MNRTCLIALVILPLLSRVGAAELKLEVTQITSGPQHHFFGYIGQSLTTPWNQSEKFILALRTGFHDRMPTANDAADIVLIDTSNGNVVKVDETRAWNFQQGTMFYWHPKRAETQFFFNDRDPKTQRIYTVLFDLETKTRRREYRFEQVPVANGGVSPTGEFFAAINYARMARLRPVTGYPETSDETETVAAPDNDGIYRVDIASGKRELVVSFAQLKKLLAGRHPKLDEVEFYINHSLIDRSGQRLYFYARGRHEGKSMSVNVPCSVHLDGSKLTAQPYIGGHPEWDLGSIVIGAKGDKQVRFDVDRSALVGVIGSPEKIPKPGGDVSLSGSGIWFANGYSSDDRATNRYVILNRRTNESARSPAFSRGPYQRGELRIDPAPRWNRSEDSILVPGFTEDGTRQIFSIHVSDKQ